MRVVVKRGMAFGVAAYVMWGLFPLYWPLLKPAGAVEILAHRIMWSLVAVAAVLAVRRAGGGCASWGSGSGCCWGWRRR